VLTEAFEPLNQLEIDLTAKRVDANDADADGVAQVELAAVATAFDDVLFKRCG
jgi:hypothetical protein